MPESTPVVPEEAVEITPDDRARLREIARLVEVDFRRDDAQRDARFLHRFAERPAIQDLEARIRERLTTVEAARAFKDAVPVAWRGISTVDLIAGLRAAFDQAQGGQEQ